MGPKISVIIPNHNGSATIGICLEALFASGYSPFEVIVVDDCSKDSSVEVIRNFPCRLLELDRHGGAAKARNKGAEASSGELLFFIDADCVVHEDTLVRVASAHERHGDCAIGGSYTPLAYDNSFFSNFQSVFINYSELKSKTPDYIASHAMVISRDLFMKSGGFPEEFMPIIEDVEFSHRLKRSGVRLIMDESILVRHIFNFDLMRSLKNAFRKSKYWTCYSLGNRDLFKDSGTASVELKFTVFSACLIWFFLLCLTAYPDTFFLAGALTVLTFNLTLSRDIVRAFFRIDKKAFGIKAVLYYSLIYPLAAAAGGASGMTMYLRSRSS